MDEESSTDSLFITVIYVDYCTPNITTLTASNAWRFYCVHSVLANT